MLRARKKDVRIKPNRKLDKRSSRGMLYENEELRLRTIEINAEVERGQTDIKKLRRENDHLRREMWALRDEYERLEKLIKHLDLAGTGSEHRERSERSHSDGEDGARDGGGGGGGDGDERRSPSLNGCGSDSDGRSDGEDVPDRSAASEGVPCGKARGQCGDREPRATVSDPDLGACRCLDTASYVECGNPDMDNIENYQKAYGRMPRGQSAKVFVATQHFEAPASLPSPGYESLSKARYSSASMEEEDGYAACSHLPLRIDYVQQHPVMAPPSVAPPPVPVSMPPTPTPPSPTPPLRPSLLRDPVVVVEEELVEVPDESTSSGLEAEDDSVAKGGAPPDTPSEDGHFNLDHLVNVVRSFQQEREMHRAAAGAPDDADDARSDSSCGGAGETSATATIKRRPESARQRHRSVAIIERPISSGGSSQSTGVFYSAKSSAESGAEPPDTCTYAQPIRKSARQATALLQRNPSSPSSSSSSSSTPPTPSSPPKNPPPPPPPSTTSTTIVFLNNNSNNSKNQNNNNNNNNNNDDYTASGVYKTQSASSVPGAATLSSPVRLVKEPLGEDPLAGAAVNCVSVYPLPEGDASASLLRLHAVDPHTVSFDLKEHPNGRSVTVQEVIDQLEQQLDPARCRVRGVRMLEGSVFFVSLDSARSLGYAMRHSFRLRGHRVRLVDISAQTWIVALSGVPHYISDATVSLLLAAFGTIVGDVERRFFRGVDTGERLVRFRLKGRAKLPKHITVGGVRIQVRRMSPAPDAGSRRKSQSRVRPGSGSGAAAAAAAVADHFEPEFISTATIVPEANSAPSSLRVDEELYGGKGKSANPKIGRSFEYRSQLKVDLRMSAEVPVPPDEVPASRPNVCEQQPQSIHPAAVASQSIKRQTPPPPPPPLPPGHRCRHHDAPVAAAAAATAPSSAAIAVPASGPVVAADGRSTTRESPPKSRASVNFEESIASSNVPRGSTASGIGRSSSSKAVASSPANGILRKSVSGEDPALDAGTDGGNATTQTSGPGSGGDAKGKAALRLGVVKKTARSFSLVDTFRVNRERRKPALRVETLIENASSSNPEEGVRTVVVRRDSAESSSRSSRGSRKSNELPWCGCWGNGCL